MICVMGSPQDLKRRRPNNDVMQHLVKNMQALFSRRTCNHSRKCSQVFKSFLIQTLFFHSHTNLSVRVLTLHVSDYMFGSSEPPQPTPISNFLINFSVNTVWYIGAICGDRLLIHVILHNQSLLD